MEQIVLITPEPISPERISFLINEKKINPIIASIDLEMVKYKLQDSEEGLGWTQEQCDYAEIEYKRFLHLSRNYNNSTIVPNQLMDAMWHQHILDTRAYHKDSENIFGNYLHHFPYFGMRSESDKKELESSFEQTKLLYVKEFENDMIKDDFSNYSKCNSSCNSSGKCNSRCGNK